ncbi:MAG: hypothetical protein A2X86_13270 [Bdellovibrionales bacterium GWA2_49_15]|nr:MAG: hypothetical protein A2X86_13270 [Bdellovibrionales bacterium GWA2_49_15]HAZ13495.1 hypothetical protein [Bdellovibrionales bacterium]
MNTISRAFVLVTLLSLASCTTVLNKSQPNGALGVSVSSNLAADVEVIMSKKLKGSASESALFGMINTNSSGSYLDGVSYGDSSSSGFSFFSGGILDRTKSAAAYNAVKSGGEEVDVLVAPQYIVNQKSYFFGAYKVVTVQVSGYAGRIRSIKNK